MSTYGQDRTNNKLIDRTNNKLLEALNILQQMELHTQPLHLMPTLKSGKKKTETYVKTYLA